MTMDGQIFTLFGSGLTLAWAGSIALQVAAVLMMGTGVMLWLMGKRLAKPACTGVWMLTGLLVTGAICRLTGDGGLLILWLVVGALIFGAIGWLLYRFCLAMALALVLGLTAPAVVHFAQSGMPSSETMIQNLPQTDDDASQDILDSAEKIRDQAKEKTESVMDAVKESSEKATDVLTQKVKKVITDSTRKILDPSGSQEESDQDSADSAPTSIFGDPDDISSTNPPTAEGVMATLRQLTQGPWEKLSSAWQGMENQGRNNIIIAAILGGICGFLLGLIFPKLGASAGSSLLGTVFMTTGLITLLSFYKPDVLTYLDNRTPLCLMGLGLITVIGIAIQWTLERRRTDN